MRSPFPGMDPFIESQEWKDFHTQAIAKISDFLAPQIEPNYISRVERRIYVETETGEPISFRDADVDVVAQEHEQPQSNAATMTATTIAPVECLLPSPDEQHEAYLEIRDPRSKEVITVIELLSPTNKRFGSDGWKEYLTKRQQILGTRTHLVEIDLLRGGRRMPSLTKLPPGDYYTVVSRGYQRPRAWVYAWPLAHRLPIIPVPLRKGEDDASIDLQAIHDAVYANSRYHISLDYQWPLSPPLDDERQQWASELISSRREQ